MKLILLILLFIPLNLFAPPWGDLKKNETHFKALNRHYLISAIEYVESRGDIKAYNKKEHAAGCLQIRPIMLKEVNRVSGKNYTLQDRYDRDKSYEMFYIIMDKYNPDYDLRIACRVWNGRGNSGKGSESYYQKVFKIYINNGYPVK